MTKTRAAMRDRAALVNALRRQAVVGFEAGRAARTVRVGRRQRVSRGVIERSRLQTPLVDRFLVIRTDPV